MIQPAKYSVDVTGAMSMQGTKLQIVVLQLFDAQGNAYAFALTKEDAIVLGLELQTAAGEAKRVQDVKLGVTG